MFKSEICLISIYCIHQLNELNDKQGVMLDFAFWGELMRNLGVVYRNFMPYRDHVSLREALLQGVRGGTAHEDRRVLKILQFFQRKNINFADKFAKLF